MGMYGTGILDNDTSAGVYEEFEELLKDNDSEARAEARLKHKKFEGGADWVKTILENHKQGEVYALEGVPQNTTNIDFRLGLAAVCHHYGIITAQQIADVKHIVDYDEEGNAGIYQSYLDKALIPERKQVLKDFLEEIMQEI